MPSEGIETAKGLIRQEIERLEGVLAILDGKESPKATPRRRPRRKKRGPGRPPKAEAAASPPGPSPAAPPKRRRRRRSGGGTLKERALAVIRESPGVTRKQLGEAVGLKNPESTYLYTVLGELKRENMVFRDGNGYSPVAGTF